MKFLIVGEPGSAQQQVLRALGVDYTLPENPSGICLEHTFESKYFSETIGIWVDQYTDSGEWARTFSSKQARQVRKALGMVIFTISPSTLEHLENLKIFVMALSRDHPGLPISGFSSQELSNEDHDRYYSCGINIVEEHELLDGAHAAIFDFEPQMDYDGDDESGEPFEHTHELMEPLVGDPMDMSEIMSTLRDVRNSNATDEEKRIIAERLARELVP